MSVTEFWLVFIAVNLVTLVLEGPLNGSIFCHNLLQLKLLQKFNEICLKVKTQT